MLLSIAIQLPALENPLSERSSENTKGIPHVENSF